MPMTSFGIGLPQIAPPGDELPDLGIVARRAEELGFEALWVSELSSAPVLDPLAVLAHAAGQTSHVRLGVAVVLAPLRIPVRLAQTLASLDVLSRGRLIVGLGYGSKPEIYARYGLSPERRLRRYLDGIDLMLRLWSEDEVDFENEWWTLKGPANVVKPVQRPHPPLWFGARSEPALRRAVKRGDGWIASGSIGAEEFQASLATVREQLEADGRDPASFTIAKRMYVAVTSDPARARERMRGWFAAAYGTAELADRVAVVGDAEHCAEQVQALTEAGVSHVLLNPVFDELEQVEALAELAIPDKRTTETGGGGR